MKNFIEKLMEIMALIGQNKKRVLLTAFGVFWGLLLLVLLLGFGKGLRNGVDSQFAGTGNTVYLWRNAVTQIPYRGYAAGRWVGLEDADLAAINREVEGVGIAIGVNEVGGWSTPQYVAHGVASGSYVIQGTHPQVFKMNGYAIHQGRFVNEFDAQENRKVAVLGRRVYRELFGSDNAVGKSINIAGLRFQVVGVFEPLSTGPQSTVDSELVLIPNSTLRLSFDQMSYVNMVRVAPKPGYHAGEVEAQVKALLKERWNIHPDDSGVYGSYNTQAEYDRLMSLFMGIEVFSWFVAIGTVISGVVGVGNIMLIAVRERTKEIGLRRAIGATAKSIVSMVVQEALIIVLSAGYLGLLVGINILIAVSVLAEKIAPNSGVFANPEVDFKVIVIALLSLAIGGVLSAVYPALRATRISPVEALQD